MLKVIRYCTSLNGRVIQRSLNGRKNLLSICLVHLFVHSTQAILRLQWMLDYEDVPGEHDACEYLWGSERINHPASNHKMTGSPTGFNGSQCFKGIGFPIYFSSSERGFLGVYIHVFSYIFLLTERFFEVLFFLCFEILLYIFPVLPL